METDKKKTTRKEPRAHIPEEQMRTHGGARPGAGRPRTGSKAIQFKAPKEMAEFIEQQPNRSAFIKECVERMMRRPTPQPLPEGRRGEVTTANGWDDSEDKVSSPRPMGISAPIPLGEGKGEALIPFVDVAVAAGSPIGTDAVEYGERTNLISFFPDAKVALRVEGRSMEDADIHSGDVLLVDNEVSDVEEDRIALCELNGAYTVKHVHREPDGTYLLLPRNEAYRPIPVTPADRFFIRGRVVAEMKGL